MQRLLNVLFAVVLCALFALTGCSTVTYLPLDPEETFPPIPEGAEIPSLSQAEAIGYRVIGSVSCQDSASSSIWNWWTDQQALIMEMRGENLERLCEKIREIGGHALIGLTHDIGYGGSSGGVGVGMGVGIGSGPVGVGVGTSLFSGNPRIVVVSYGQVGIKDDSSR